MTQKTIIVPVNRSNTFKLSPEVYEYMKNNHLCFKCGEKCIPGHQCKPKKLNCMVGEIEEVADESNNPQELIIEGEIEHEMQEPICLSALSGSNKGENSILVK